jgi:hypothetical protein
MESPPFTLGGNYMKFTPAFLICAAFLIPALPIRADSLSYTGTADDSRNTENSAPGFHASAMKMLSPAIPRAMTGPFSAAAPVGSRESMYLARAAESSLNALSATTFGTSARRPDAPQIDGQLSDPTPAITSIGGFDSSSSFAAWGSGPSFIVGTIFPPSPDTSIHSGAPDEINPGDPALSFFDSEGALRKIGRERGKRNDGKDPDKAAPPSALVPEPAALPLLLLGLAAVGIGARRRNVFPAAEWERDHSSLGLCHSQVSRCAAQIIR